MEKLTKFFSKELTHGVLAPAARPLINTLSGQCDMTAGEEPLVCGCGHHSAVWEPPRKKQKARWMVLSARLGHKPQRVTNVNTKAKALERVKAICAAAAAAPSMPPTSATPSRSLAAQLNLRQQPTINYDDTARVAAKPAGPGRGHTGKRPATATALDQADAVLKKPSAGAEELRDALVHLAAEHRLLQRWYGKAISERNQAYALLRDEYATTCDSCCKGKTAEKSEEERKTRRRAVITELVGEGYDLSGSQRTFQRHKALILAQIKQLAGRDDSVAQQQLAEAVLCHYKSDKEAGVELGSNEYQAHVAVIEGLVETLETLRKRNNGRFPTKGNASEPLLSY